MRSLWIPLNDRRDNKIHSTPHAQEKLDEGNPIVNIIHVSKSLEEAFSCQPLIGVTKRPQGECKRECDCGMVKNGV